MNNIQQLFESWGYINFCEMRNDFRKIFDKTTKLHINLILNFFTSFPG